MNCSYRILKNVHIGQRVRKTKDKTTVPYLNEPITDVYIEDWNVQGFYLKHEAFPTKNNTIWLDFGQLPLNKLNIEMGYIKNPIVFVEQILSYGGSTSMVLLRADTFDYLELLEDHKYKVESDKIKPTQLKPGDQVISCICRESLPMIFLGRFRYATRRQKRNYGYGRNEYQYIVDEAPEHAFFAYPNKSGTGYNVESYPLTNKKIVELYRAEDKGKSFEENRFSDLETNKLFLRAVLNDTKIKNYNDQSHIEGNPIRLIRLNGSHYYYYYSVHLADGKLKRQQAIDEAKLYFESPEFKHKNN